MAEGREFRAVDWKGGEVVLMDQARLPAEEVYLHLADWREVVEAIRAMRVRGAPAIGIAAAYGVVLAAKEGGRAEVERACDALARARPTAVNLPWAVRRMREVAGRSSPESLFEDLLAEAHRLAREQDAADRAIGRLGAELLPEGCRVLTHCNAGGLATYSFGTALGVIKEGFRRGKVNFVWVDETRPLLQGARLTAWELQREGVDMAVICDNMAGHLIARGEVDVVITGADRIAANGDTANKIGTYTLAVLARHHGLPFYVAAPLSTLDLSIADGSAIPIEERDASEVTDWGGRRTVPEGVRARNFSFDVTPAELITAIITERGVVRAPYGESLLRLLGSQGP
ncbi:MAG: S-methyl-5-thioribose-1-phosphate isomerase [Actinomycetota bacterium]|nr:S-methyl-5-thioribose-1-phosphate isomerase [Actinomycetota bacterium]MDI7251894.1 S-methyl-5-thioribose-1-phosphate isomerase [Actinomycetota bacterium]